MRWQDTAGGIGSLLAPAGWTAGAVLTGRKLKQHRVPRGSIPVAKVCAVAGMFLIPGVNLFVGFGAGLFLWNADQVPALHVYEEVDRLF